MKYKLYTSELISTFTLIFCGTGAIVINNETNGVVTHAGIAVTFGAVVTAMAFAFGHISGAHMNPAVTIALWADKKMNTKDSVLYIFSQIAGALLASFSLFLLFPSDEYLGSTLPSGDPMPSFILEILLTFFLMLGILMTSSGPTAMATPIVAGLIVMLEAWFAGPITGASMNPARSLAPALVSQHTEHLWIYILAPVSGALLALLVSKIVNSKK
ncbi:MAG: MIP/aquaporin family protein [Bacteroidota bacterium]